MTRVPEEPRISLSDICLTLYLSHISDVARSGPCVSCEGIGRVRDLPLFCNALASLRIMGERSNVVANGCQFLPSRWLITSTCRNKEARERIHGDSVKGDTASWPCE